MASPTDKSDLPTVPAAGAVPQSLSSLIASLERGGKVVMLLSAASGTGKSSLTRSGLTAALQKLLSARNHQDLRSKKRSTRRTEWLVIRELTSPPGGQHFALDAGEVSVRRSGHHSTQPTIPWWNEPFRKLSSGCRRLFGHDARK